MHSDGTKVIGMGLKLMHTLEGIVVVDVELEKHTDIKTYTIAVVIEYEILKMTGSLYAFTQII